MASIRHDTFTTMEFQDYKGGSAYTGVTMEYDKSRRELVMTYPSTNTKHTFRSIWGFPIHTPLATVGLYVNGSKVGIVTRKWRNIVNTNDAEQTFNGDGIERTKDNDFLCEWPTRMSLDVKFDQSQETYCVARCIQKSTYPTTSGFQYAEDVTTHEYVCTYGGTDVPQAGENEHTWNDIEKPFAGVNGRRIQFNGYTFSTILRTAKVLHLNNWNMSNVTSINGMFGGMGWALTDLQVDQWNTYRVKDMSSCFIYDDKLFDLNLRGWTTRPDTKTKDMFAACGFLRTLDISNMSPVNVDGAGNMFNGCDYLERITCTATMRDWLIDNSDIVGKDFRGWTGVWNIVCPISGPVPSVNLG